MCAHDKMTYECNECGYETNRKANLTRHKNRKRSCVDTKSGNKNDERVENTNQKEIAPKIEGVAPKIEGGSKVDEIQRSKVEFKCSRCDKTFSSKYNRNKHVAKCNGVDSKTCCICRKVFSTPYGRYIHNKNVKCSEPVLQQFPTVNNVFNNTNNFQIENSVNCNNTNCNNQNVEINVFGSEDLTYLMQDSGIIQRLRMYGKEGLYGLPKILDDVHFNKDRPENQTIIKPEEYGNTVLIKNSNDEWEFREFEDVRDNLINTMMDYIKMYNEVKNKLDIKLIEERERHFIKKISYELMALDGSIPRNLFHELDMDENKVVDNQDAVKSKTRKFDRSTMHMIHNRTYYTYRKENGRYVRR